jgi:hypothetical protein
VVKISLSGSLDSSTVGRTNQPWLSSQVPPAMTLIVPSPLARSRAALCFANARSSMTAPMKFDRSVTSPIVIESVSDARSSRSVFQMLRGT